MPLNLGGGEGKPYIRFSPSIRAWEMSSPEGKTEFTWDAPAVFDVAGLQLGWLKIDAQGRDWMPWPSITNRLPQPEEKDRDGNPTYKLGFRIDVVSTKLFGDEPVREFSANTFGNLTFIQELYNHCEDKEEFKSGKAPVVQITGSTPMKVGKGNTQIPQFEVKKWVDRPAELSGGTTEAVVVQSAPQPAPQPAPTPAPADDDEF